MDMNFDEYMQVFEEGERRALAPIDAHTSESSVTLPEPELPGYLESVTFHPNRGRGHAQPTPPQYTALPQDTTARAGRLAPQYTAAPSSTVMRTDARFAPQYTAAPSSTVMRTTAQVRKRAPDAMLTFTKQAPRTVATAGALRTPTSPVSTRRPLPLPPDSPAFGALTTNADLPPPDATTPDTTTPNYAVPGSNYIAPETAQGCPTCPSMTGKHFLLFFLGAAAGAWWMHVRMSKRGGMHGLSGGDALATGGLGDSATPRELDLYMQNTASFATQRKPFEANAARKVRAGKYDPALAPKLWFYYVERGIHAYNKEHGRGSIRLSKNEKMALATEYARAWEAENLPGTGSDSE